MKKFCTGINLHGKTAGSKAKEDISAILQSYGYTRLEYYFGSNRLSQKINACLFVLKVKRLPKNAVVVFQYPFAGGVEADILKLFGKRSDLKVILIIHDIDFLRTNKIIDTEIGLINRADLVIVHNSSMEKAFIEFGFNKDKLINLQIFDYLHNSGDINPREKNKIIVAGNLEKKKCGYVYKLKDLKSSLHFSLYGINYSDTESENTTYHGSFSPEELPSRLEGGFGLVWDGDNLETCSGDFGNYLKFNNPHKVSLYLASGIPVILWEQSALAEFVKAHGVGITVASLNDLESAISGISEEEYLKMLQNTKALKEKLTSGFFTLKAIKAAENHLN